MDKLNAKSGLGEGRFRLPTEAQWEYACRAGSTTRYCFGDDESKLGEYAWYRANSESKTHPVGEKKSNAWGLYDMHGNVCELCQDWCESDFGYYAKSPTDDPTGPPTGVGHAGRGIGWNCPAGGCRSAARIAIISLGYRDNCIGFRAARVLVEARVDTRLPVSIMPLKIQPIPPQTIEAGKPLSVVVTVEDPQRWNGKLRYTLAPDAHGATIDSHAGVFTWTPPSDQPAGQTQISVSAISRDGQMTQTSFIVTVTRPIPAPPLPPKVSGGKEIAIDLGGGVKLEMVLIAAGEFLMGSPASDRNAGGDEKPEHRVRITKPFYLGKYLVTQEQWKAVMGSNPSSFKGPKNPVERVSWDDCQQFLDKLNRREGNPGKFQLPTEAQWEYACRAGSRTRYCFGDDESGLGKYAWYGNNSGGKTHPVGEKKPNAWRLYDMHGNVWEWCQDWNDAGYYAKSPMDDPVGPATGVYRVHRGGSWSFGDKYCRSADRTGDGPGIRHSGLGFRGTLVLADTAAAVAKASGASIAVQPSDGSTANKPPLAPQIGADVASLRRRFPSARRLASNGYKPSWSPDGQQVSFSRGLNGGISIVDVKTLTFSTLIAPGTDPAWSPHDTNMIAFVRGAKLNDEEIWITNLSSKNSKRIAQGGWPVWAGDRRSLYFHSRKEGKILQISVDPPGEPVAVYDMPYTFYPPIRVDGKRTAYVDHENLVVLDIQTRAPLVKRHLGKWSGIAGGWSPDGKLLGYGALSLGHGDLKGDSIAGLWMMNVDTAQVIQVAEGPFTAPAWSPDGSKLAFDRRTVAGREIWMIETKELEKPLDAK